MKKKTNSQGSGSSGNEVTANPSLPLTNLEEGYLNKLNRIIEIIYGKLTEKELGILEEHFENREREAILKDIESLGKHVGAADWLLIEIEEIIRKRIK